MSKYLVIVESPSKAKTISGFLNNNYKIISSKGHIRDLPEHEFGVDIENNFQPKYVILPDKKKLVEEIITESKKSEKILIATDDDREGEAIAYHLAFLMGIDVNNRNRYDRIVFHEITETAIKKAIENPRSINISLFDAQQARRILDRIVGYKLSPLLWQKISKGLSAGRVQSVAVRLIVEKEREIEKFVPQETWEIKAILQKENNIFEAIFDSKNEIKNKSEAIEILKKLSNNEINEEISKKNTLILNIKNIQEKAIIKNINKKDSKRSPNPPFTTSTLQQEASSKLGYTVKQTMQIAQILYEGVETHKGRMGLITYMRTDSVNISDLALDQINKTILSLYGEKYLSPQKREYKTKLKTAQQAHEAIRPTDISILPQDIKPYLKDQEYKLYKLIWERTISSQMADAIIENTIIDIDILGLNFISKGHIIKFDGFLKVYDSKEKDDILPDLKINEKINIKEYIAEQKFSSPPSRYTEGTLVKKLESLGIGRPSTYAPTISTIIERRYIEKTEDKKLKPTKLGIMVNDFLIKYFPEILDYTFTAKVEEDLDKIEENQEKWQNVISNFYNKFNEQYKNVYKTAEKVIQYSDINCEKCGSKMIIKNGKYGQFLACSNFPKCKNIQPMPKEKEEIENLKNKYKDIKCEKCGNTMELKHSKYGYFLICNNCKNKKSIEKDIGIKCPKCNIGSLVIRKTKTGKRFFGCNRYPECDYVTWNKPKIDNNNQ